MMYLQGPLKSVQKCVTQLCTTRNLVKMVFNYCFPYFLAVKEHVGIFASKTFILFSLKHA